MVNELFVNRLLGFQRSSHEVSQEVSIFHHSGDLDGALPVIIVGTLTESQLNNIFLLQVGRVVQNGVLGRGAGALGHLLGHQVEVPVLFGHGIITNDSTGLGVEQALLVLGEESFRNTFLHDNFHKLGVVLKPVLGNVLETVENLFDFIF